MNILHGLTGSVASTLFPKIRQTYILDEKKRFDARYIFTTSAQNFISFDDFWFGDDELNDDASEWENYKYQNNVQHIELAKWADAFIIAPCSANTLAKIANGICDNLLTCVARAWDFDKQFIVALSMNTNMWTHPITQEHIKKIEGWGIKVIEPVEKTLFCGDTGIGAMAHIDDIVSQIKL